MAVYRLIIKVSPDLSFPLEPHPGTNPASWMSAPMPNPPITPKMRPEDVPPPDVWWFNEPHPSLNVATWEQNRFTYPPLFPKQRPERSPMSEYPFPVEPHPSLNAATWEQAPQPANRPVKPPRPDIDQPAIIPAVIPSSISTWSHLQPQAAPIAKRWVRPVVDEPMTYAAANPSLAWARWDSDEGPRQTASIRRQVVALADQPFIAATSAPLLTPDKWESIERPRFRPEPIVRDLTDFVFSTDKHPSLNPGVWETSRFPVPPAVERRSYAERRKHDEPQFIPRNPAFAPWNHMEMPRQWITQPKRRQELVPRLPIIDDVFWVLLVRNLLPDSIVSTVTGYLNNRDIDGLLNDRTLMAYLMRRTMENL